MGIFDPLVQYDRFLTFPHGVTIYHTHVYLLQSLSAVHFWFCCQLSNGLLLQVCENNLVLMCDVVVNLLPIVGSLEDYSAVTCHVQAYSVEEVYRQVLR